MRVPVHQSMNDSGTARLVVENACLRYGQLDVLADLSLRKSSALWDRPVAARQRSCAASAA
jgi:hypothetical protein